MLSFLKVLPQYLLPKQALTNFAGLVAGYSGGARTTTLIAWFVKRYDVNMAEAAEPDISKYATFNDFFTRALRANARPLAKAPHICPVDGAISQFGAITGDQVFQAKGHSYSTTALVGGNAELAKQFESGSFATLYLSPKDYHRIHMPCAAKLLKMIYVPGALFSVNPTTARGVPGLFARNERVVCVFEATAGKLKGMQFVQVLVGATIVGSMATTWAGVINPPRTREVREWDYATKPIHFRQGEEMGRFLLGSTVVMLWPKNTISFNPAWQPTGAIRMGEAMGV